MTTSPSAGPPAGDSRRGRGATAPLANPYAGPRPFRPEEKLFGRDREVKRVFELLVSDRIVLIYSPSGAGKSSLIRAGLKARLEKDGFDVLPIVRVKWETDGGQACSEKDYNRYVLSTLQSLGETCEAAFSGAAPRGERLAAYLKKRDDDRPESHLCKVLVFDQFEEILTAHPNDHQVKEEFFEEVSYALQDRRYYAIFSIREDFLAALDPYRAKLPNGARTTFRLNLLTREAALQAIHGPARAQQVAFAPGEGAEPGVAEQLVTNLSRVRLPRAEGDAQPGGDTVELPGTFVEPAQLQVVCWNLWEGARPAPGDTLRKEHLAQFGDVDRALGRYYAECLRAALEEPSEVEERTLRHWIETQLITDHGTRNFVQQKGAEAAGVPKEAIEVLVDKYLLRREERGGWKWLELTHDRLITPIRQSNADWFQNNLHPMQLAARAWHRAGNLDSLTLSDTPLSAAEEWAKKHDAELDDVEKAFLARSRELREFRRQAEVARLEQEAARRRKEADERARSRQLISLQRRRAINVFLLILVALLAVFLGALWFAYSRKEEAVKKALSSERAVDAKLRSQEDPELGLLIAYAALDIYPTDRQQDSAAYRVLIDLLSLSDGRVLLGHKGSVLKIGVTRKWIITAGMDGVAYLWDRSAVASGGALRDPVRLAGHQLPIVHFAVDQEEKWLATASVDKTVRFWKLDEPGGEAYATAPQAATVLRVIFFQGSDGTPWACSGGTDGALTFYSLEEVSRGKKAGHGLPPGSHRGRVSSLDVTEYERHRYLASASADKQLRVWKLDDLLASFHENKPITLKDVSYLLGGHANSVTDLGFTHREKGWLLTASSDVDGGGNVRLWRLGTLLSQEGSDQRIEPKNVPSLSCVLKGHQRVTALKIGAGDRTLITASNEDQSCLWDLEAILRRCNNPNDFKDGIDDPRVRRNLRATPGPFPILEVSPEGTYVTTSSTDPVARLWNARSAFADETMTPHPEHKMVLSHRVSAVAFSGDPDGLVITGSDDGRVCVWKLAELGWEKEHLRVDIPAQERKKHLRDLPVDELKTLCVKVLHRRLKREVIDKYIAEHPGSFPAGFRFPLPPPG
jgi:WD40 repeat protein